MHECPTHWTLRTIVRTGICMPQAPPPYRLSRAIWGVAIYLIGFLILLFVVSKYYLIPAFVAEQGATPEQRRILVAHSWLILALVLFVLLVGLVLTFRVGRFFFPATRERAKPTEYVDAWQEAGRRLRVDDEQKSED
jgi:formate hydrogenlyase subunit 3/multisubunit Na+/H+ antiporter MnhD subunit